MTNLSIRPLEENDIPYIVRYWFENDDENLLRIGADKAKFICPHSFAQSLEIVCKTPLEQVKSYYLVWLIDNKPIGYNALKDICVDGIAHMHLNMWDSAYRGKGYGAKLFCMAALKFYQLFQLKMILCEPRSTNPMPNKMLTKIGFQKWKTYVSTASELALTCELNSYIINPTIAANFLV